MAERYKSKYMWDCPKVLTLSFVAALGVAGVAVCIVEGLKDTPETFTCGIKQTDKTGRIVVLENCTSEKPSGDGPFIRIDSSAQP